MKALLLSVSFLLIYIYRSFYLEAAGHLHAVNYQRVPRGNLYNQKTKTPLFSSNPKENLALQTQTKGFS
jgi:hypothetical protein